MLCLYASLCEESVTKEIGSCVFRPLFDVGACRAALFVDFCENEVEKRTCEVRVSTEERLTNHWL